MALFCFQYKIEIYHHRELSRKHIKTMLRRENRTSWDLRFMPATRHTIPPPILHGPTLEEVVYANKHTNCLNDNLHVHQNSTTRAYLDEETGEIFDCPTAPAIK